MRDTISLTINDSAVSVVPAASVASAIIQAGAFSRLSQQGHGRQPLCGMGICYECRVHIDGRPHQRSCQILCEPGMRVTTE